MRKEFITIIHTSTYALLYNFGEREYYYNNQFRVYPKKYPGIGYYILIPICVFFAHQIDDTFAVLLSSDFFIFLIVTVSMILGIVVGATSVRLFYKTDKLHSPLVRCSQNEVIENYSLIYGGICRVQGSFLALAAVYVLTASFALFVIASHSGILICLILVLFVGVCTFFTCILHPIEQVKYYASRIHLLDGHDNRPWLGILLFRFYRKRSDN